MANTISYPNEYPILINWPKFNWVYSDYSNLIPYHSLPIFTGAIQACVFNEDSNQAHPHGKTACCGKSADPEFYFTKTQICCNGTVHNRHGKQCCDGEYFLLYIYLNCYFFKLKENIEMFLTWKQTIHLYKYRTLM